MRFDAAGQRLLVRADNADAVAARAAGAVAGGVARAAFFEVAQRLAQRVGVGFAAAAAAAGLFGRVLVAFTGLSSFLGVSAMVLTSGGVGFTSGFTSGFVGTGSGFLGSGCGGVGLSGGVCGAFGGVCGASGALGFVGCVGGPPGLPMVVRFRSIMGALRSTGGRDDAGQNRTAAKTAACRHKERRKLAT